MFRSEIPGHCTPITSLLIDVSSFFHACVPTPLAFLSTLLGVLSIISWLFAQLPQIIKNYRLGSAAGLSMYFLIEWLLGDLTNLCGAMLTHQASWQVVVASYYVSVDVALVWQYIWYSHIKRVRKEKLEDCKTENHGRGKEDSSDVLVGISPIGSASNISDAPAAERKAMDGKAIKGTSDWPSRSREVRNNSVWFSTFSFSGEKASSNRTITRSQHCSHSPVPSPKTILFISMLLTVLTQASPLHPTLQSVDKGTSNPYEFAGRIVSWCSTLLYLGSRIPQIYKNHIRRSTAGLSPTLFIAAFFGNLFYSTSLLTDPLAWSSYPPYGLHGWVGKEGSNREIWVALAAPFWLGAAGVLALDATIGVQFLIFGERGEERVAVTKDERGRSHWKKVSGWMRGWVPSPSPSPARRSEEERLLVERDARGERYGAA